MKALIIDCTVVPKSWGSAELRRISKLASGASFYTRRAPQEDLPRDPSGFDKILISGSETSCLADAPWIDKLIEFIRKTLDSRKPLLGVCFGEQYLARALGGKSTVRVSPTPEFGWTRIERTDESRPSPLLAGIPPVFHSFSSHFEEVFELPPGTRKLAQSETCGIQAFQVGDSPHFGIQFHPEKNLAEGTTILKEKKRLGKPKTLLNPDQGPKLYDSTIGEIIYRNFLQL